jgi:hypothetical protein
VLVVQPEDNRQDLLVVLVVVALGLVAQPLLERLDKVIRGVRMMVAVTLMLAAVEVKMLPEVQALQEIVGLVVVGLVLQL